MADASQITTAFVEEYKNNVEMLVQQMGSKLRGSLSEDNYTGKAGEVVNQVGEVTAQTITDRHGDTPILGTPMDRRWVYPIGKHWGDMIDDEDRMRMFIDSNLESYYTKTGAMAIGRAIDDEIIGAFFGTAKTGENGSTNKSFLSTQVVAVDKGAAAATGLNVSKLKAARKLFRKNEVDLDMEEAYMAITAEQEENLLEEIQVINQDYNSNGGRPILEEGRLRRYLGFNFIQIERLTTDANGYRRVPVWVPSGMHLGTWNELFARVTPERVDKSYNTQVYVKQTFGATRVQEKKVVEIKCAE